MILIRKIILIKINKKVNKERKLKKKFKQDEIKILLELFKKQKVFFHIRPICNELTRKV